MRYRSRDVFNEGIIIQHKVEGKEDFELNIHLKRLLAKVVFSYNCENIEGITGVTMRGFGVNNLATNCSPFKDNGFATTTSYTEDIQLGSVQAEPIWTKMFYIPANYPGRNTELTLTQSSRTLANAPKAATYISFTIKGKPIVSHRQPSLTSSSVDVTYPLFLGNPDAATNCTTEGAEAPFEDFDVLIGYNYNINLSITKYDPDDPRLVYTKIEPLLNGVINADGKVAFAKETSPGVIERITSITPNEECFVDILIDAKGANNQNFSVIGILQNPDYKNTFSRIVALDTIAGVPGSKWLKTSFIIENDDSENPYPSENYNENFMLRYSGELLRFNDTEENIKRAFRFYFKYTGSGIDLKHAFSTANRQTLRASELPSGIIAIE